MVVLRGPRAAPMVVLRAPRRHDAFNRGNPVEVLSVEPGLRGSYFPAVIVGPSTDPGTYTVEYDASIETLDSDRPLREIVREQELRPRPPPRLWGWQPTEHAIVDAFIDDGWWLGVALRCADGRGKVSVCFPDTREVIKFDAANVRPHLEWAAAAGEWHFPETRILPKTTPYIKEMIIEVSKLEDDSVVAWLPAVVTKTIWESNLLVRYTVSKSDGIALSEEIVDVKHVRPCRPQAPPISFCINDKVEAFRDGGWWLGVITNVHPGSKYTFKFSRSGMKIKLRQTFLRLRMDWVNGLWKQKSQSTIKKRKTQVDGPPDPEPRLTKKHKSPKLGPSEENKRRESSSKEIYPELPEKRLLRDADTPCQDDQAQPAPQPKPTPAPAQRRKSFLKFSLPMIQPTAAPDTTVSSLTRECDAENTEAVHNTVSTAVAEAETCSKSPVESLPTPLDVIIKDLKDYREQWLQAQSQLDHSATKAKEMEGHVAKLRAAREADAMHLREVMDKQASLERKLELKDKEIEDLKKKLVDLNEQKSCIEAELPRGAVMAASHALGVLKNHLPDLDIGILSKGYACTPAEAQALADGARAIVEPFIDRLGLSNAEQALPFCPLDFSVCESLLSISVMGGRFKDVVYTRRRRTRDVRRAAEHAARVDQEVARPVQEESGISG